MKGQGKILMIIMDGMGDRAVDSLGWRTPLQVANHPNIDWFAKEGTSGIVDTISPGIRPGSDTAHLSLLGYDPFQIYTGRGPFEAAGVGLVGEEGDVAFRCNFATVNGSMKVVDRRAGRIRRPDTTELVSPFKDMEIDGIKIEVQEATEHRAVLVLKGKGLSPKVTDVDPHKEGALHECRPLSPEAEKTARVVDEFVRRSHQLMRDHPVNRRRGKEGKNQANILLPRGAGSFPHIQSFEEKWGLRASCVSGVGLIKGIGRVLGMNVVERREFTGGLDTDMHAKVGTALELLRRDDFVLMNIKAPDIPSHDGDARSKVEVAQRIDGVIGELRSGMDDETVVAFMADHCTPIEVKDHSGDPVPLTIYCDSALRDGNSRFDECSNAGGALGRLRGSDVLPILLDKVNRSQKFGA
ncbi:MAG: 2,3-bisphosphoglycerate-independent phosphoglycerate mutase [Methanomassiliicoccales archaeon]